MDFRFRFHLLAPAVLLSLGVFGFFLEATAGEHDQFRDFTNENGKKTTARVIDKADGQVRILRQKDRKIFTIDIAKLSKEDQEYLQSWIKPATIKRGLKRTTSRTRNSWYPHSIDAVKVEIEAIASRDSSHAGFEKAELRALANLNAQRFLSGVPSDVLLDESLNIYARAGASLCRKLGRLEHKPAKPEKMSEKEFKIAYTGTSESNLNKGSSLEACPLSFIYDRGNNNLAEQGHRRWCLNPAMSKTGFGADGRFTAMYAIDGSRAKTPAYEIIACPGRGYIPTSMFMENLLWTISLHPRKFAQPNKDDLKIAVYRIKALQSPDSKEAREKPMEIDYLGVSQKSFANSSCIMFRPKGYKVRHDSRYLVRIAGLKHLRGGKDTFEYLVHFKDLTK